MVLGLGISAYICYAKAKTVTFHNVRLTSHAPFKSEICNTLFDDPDHMLFSHGVEC